MPGNTRPEAGVVPVDDGAGAPGPVLGRAGTALGGLVPHACCGRLAVRRRAVSRVWRVRAKVSRVGHAQVSRASRVGQVRVRISPAGDSRAVISPVRAVRRVVVEDP